jgi:hypothetical protein
MLFGFVEHAEVFPSETSQPALAMPVFEARHPGLFLSR